VGVKDAEYVLPLVVIVSTSKIRELELMKCVEEAPPGAVVVDCAFPEEVGIVDTCEDNVVDLWRCVVIAPVPIAVELAPRLILG
jgi:hypothetical protein